MSPAVYRQPVRPYLSAEVLRSERENLFRTLPLLVALSGDLARPGSFVVDNSGEIPLLVVRRDDGQLRAFVNSCRHRGAPVANVSGESRGRFTCRYHGWTYDDGGRLVGLPSREGFTGLADHETCLRRLPVSEDAGFVFVVPGGDETILGESWLGGLSAELAPLGLDRFVPFRTHRSRRRLNWKLVIDTFLEGYHVAHLHAATLGPYIHSSPCAWDAFGPHSRMAVARKSLATIPTLREDEWSVFDHAVMLYQLFPNTIFIFQKDHVEIVRAYPALGSPDETEILYAVYTPTAVEEGALQKHFDRNVDILLSVTEGEDFAAGEQIQRGFHADPGGTIYFGRNEPGLAHFHGQLDRFTARRSSKPLE